MFKKLLQYGLILAAFTVSSCTTGRSAHPTAAKQTQLSERLHKIKMTDLKGRPMTLQNLAGKPVFLNFWATWCGPCVSEMQSIEAVYQQFKNDIVFLAVSNEDADKIRSYVEKQKFSFEFGRLDMAYIDAYVVTLPTTLLIDRNGRLVSEEEGFRIWTQYANLEKLKALANR